MTYLDKPTNQICQHPLRRARRGRRIRVIVGYLACLSAAWICFFSEDGENIGGGRLRRFTSTTEKNEASSNEQRKTYRFSDGVDPWHESYLGRVGGAHEEDFDEEEIVESMKIGRTEEQEEQEPEGKEDSDIVKPKMYTFFHRIYHHQRNTGMSDEGDDAMLALWQEEWTAAGFETHILTLKDAYSHPRFAEFEEQLQNIPLNVPTKIYNQMCFIRHLAMANVGGGYMSDYDVLPMTHRTMNQEEEHSDDWLSNFSINDDIQIYSVTAGGGGIPCLMSGSASKWETLAFRLIDNGLKHPDERLWTDFLAMIDLTHENEFTVNDSVLKTFDIHPEWTKELCDEVSGFSAVHFSHHTLKVAKVKVDRRAGIAREWLQNWRHSCYP